MTEELKQNSAIFSKTWYEDNTKSYAANHEITFNQTCDVAIIGGGLAGTEAAWQLAERGFLVMLYEMRPVRKTGAHVSNRLGELVCSNSLG